MRFVCFSLLMVGMMFMVGCSSDLAPVIEEPDVDERIVQAGELLAGRKYPEALALLNKPFDTKDDEESRLLLMMLGQTWLGQWDEAVQSLNDLATRVNKPDRLPFIKPLSIKEGTPLYHEFTAPTFSEDDVLFIWRQLWLERIVNRILDGVDDPMTRVVIIMDYVYRHVQFGVIEGGFINDKPFNVLIKGQGFCDELAWLTHQMLRAAGFEVVRTVMWTLDKKQSRHTMGMVKVDGDWIPIDSAVGLILQNPLTGKPEGFPRNFILNPSKETYKEYGGIYPRKELDNFVRQIRSFGHFKKLGLDLVMSHAFVDYEAEMCMPRMLWLNERLKSLRPIAALAHPYVKSVAPKVDDRTRKIIQWRSVLLKYLYENSHEKNLLRRHYANETFKHLHPIRVGRMALLTGNYARAEQAMIAAINNKEKPLDPRAMVDAFYYMSVSTYEGGKFQVAKERFEEMLKRYPKTQWKARIYYHLALISQRLGDDDSLADYLKKSQQHTDGSLFQWVTTRGVVSSSESVVGE